MKFTLYAYFERHPLQKKIAKWWTARGLPLPEALKRHLANQIHAEMIARLMRVVVTQGSLDMQQALRSQYELGEEIAAQTADFLSINPNDARSLSRIIDFLHNLLGIHGKIEISASASEVTCHWTKCPLAAQLRESPDASGPYYCHLYQEMYKGVLHAINPNAGANTLTLTQSMGYEFCELKTQIIEPETS